MTVVGLVLGPIIALAAVSSHIVHSAARDGAERAVAGAASAGAVAVSEQLRGLSDVVESYSTRGAVRGAMSSPVDVPTVQRALDELYGLRNDITLAFVTDGAGALVSVTPETPSIVGQSFAFRDWYRGAVTSGSVYVSEAYETAASGHAFVVSAAAPIYSTSDDQALEGFLVAGYDLAILQRFVDEYSDAQQVWITITDQRGTVIAKTGAPQRALASAPDDGRVAAALRGESGVGMTEEPDSSVVYAYVPVPRIGWTVTAEIPTDVAYSSANTVNFNIAVATVLITVSVGIGIVIVLLQQRRREQVEAALRQTSALLSTIVDNNPQAIMVSDADLRFVRVNSAGERLLGIPAEQLVGRTVSQLEDLLPSGFRWDEGAAVLTSGVAAEHPTQIITSRDGAERVIHTIKIPISSGDDEDGRLLLRISEDITERVRTDRLMRDAQQVAEDANRAKSEFLSRMSHELRTPLNAVIGFAQLLEQDGLNPEQRDSARQIRYGGQHLLDLINEVLDISLIETGRMRVSLEPVRLGDVIDESLSLVGPLARSRSIQMPPGHRQECDMHVMGDRQRLKQVLLNLLTNAVKYNRDHGTVEVTCQPTPEGRVRVAVTDSGPGIPRDKFDLVFLPFERLGAESSDVDGTGLGLALSRGLVAAMGGEIGVTSESGSGTTFWVELKCVTPPADAVPLTSSPSPQRQAADVTGSDKTVLYIEDNLSNVKLVERILASTPQYELVIAMHGELGIDLAKTRRPDLVLLDLHLPDMGGREILARLRAEPETQAVPVIVISADATSEQISRLMSAGATGYLTKPIDVNEFRRMLTTYLDAAEVCEESVEVESPTPGGAVVQSDQIPVAGEAHDATALDDGAVHNLRELFTDPADIHDFLSTLDRELSVRLQALREAIAAADPSSVRLNAHALRGMLGSIGAKRASVLCASIEDAPEQSRDTLSETETRLRDSIEQARSEIHARLLKDR